MKFLYRSVSVVLVSYAVAAAMTSCVDNDYDLSKDIDLNVTVGGDLTLPSSNTESYTMAQILDLNANSSIKPDGGLYGLSAGDYVLVQGGDPIRSTVAIPLQTFNNINCEAATGAFQVVSPGSGTTVTFNVTDFSNNISIADTDIDVAVTSISRAVTDISMNFRIAVSAQGAGGSISILPGFAMSFPAGWTVALNGGQLSAYAEMRGGKLVFTREYKLNVNTPLDIPLSVTALDLTELPSGQGLYAPGKFRLEDKIISGGPMSYTPSSSPAGTPLSLTLGITPSIPRATVRQVTGVVKPDVSIASTSFDINDVPDFLKEPGNNLDIHNPQINFSVKNGSPVEVDINCRILATYDDGSTREVWVGDDHGTAPVMVAASTTTGISISRTGKGAQGASVSVEVPGLAEIISTVPRSITIDNITAEVPAGRECTFELGRDYDMQVDYKAVVPLAFGPDLKFVYSTDEKDWGEDLSKYSFRQVVATMEVVNTAPLSMIPEVVALDRQGNEITDVTATVEGTVDAGSISMPSTSSLKVILRSDAANIGNLDGVRFSFSASCPVGMAGTPLNEKQSLRFSNIKLKLVGGVGVDLN